MKSKTGSMENWVRCSSVRSFALAAIVICSNNVFSQDPLTYKTIVCRDEFAAAYHTVADALSECTVNWDVDIAPSQSGQFPVVWEEARQNGDGGIFLARYRSQSGTGPICTLSKGGNPELFDGIVTWHAQSRLEIHWIETSTIDAGLCDFGRDCDCSQAGQNHGVLATLNGQEPLEYIQGGYQQRKAAVTDGKVIIWWECEGKCRQDDAGNIDLWGYRIPDATDPNDVGTLFPVDLGIGKQIRPRVIRLAANRHLVVYEDRPDSEISRVVARVLDLDNPTVAGPAMYLDPNLPADLDYANWPDVHGDIAVWDRPDPTNAGIAIYGCQFNATYSSCGPPFRITDTPGDQKKPTVYEDLVAWSDTRRAVAWEADCCSTHANIFAGLLLRDATSGAVRLVSDTARAVVAEGQVAFDEPARQRAPRAANGALLWSDTRSTGCATSDAEYGILCPDSGQSDACEQYSWTCTSTDNIESSGFCCPDHVANRTENRKSCDDALGATNVSLVPLVDVNLCLADPFGNVTLSVKYTNDYTQDVTGVLVDRAQCYTKSQNGNFFPCDPWITNTDNAFVIRQDDETIRIPQCACPAGTPADEIWVEYNLISFTPSSPATCVGDAAQILTPERINCIAGPRLRSGLLQRIADFWGGIFPPSTEKGTRSRESLGTILKVIAEYWGWAFPPSTENRTRSREPQGASRRPGSGRTRVE